MPYDEMAAVTSFCAEKGIPTHLDGARLYMMSAATGISPEIYAALFDTAYVSLYKYFGAPYGGILAGTSEFIEGLYHDRRMFGGGLASAYMSAALALKGILGFEARFGAAMSQAAELFERLNALPGIHVGRYEDGSNIYPVELDARVDFERFASALKARWVFVYPGETQPGRIHLTVNTTVLRAVQRRRLRGLRVCAVPRRDVPSVAPSSAGRGTCPQLGIKLVRADRAETVAEIGLSVVANVRLDLAPVALVVSNLLARAADRQQAAQCLDAGQGLL